MYQKPFYITEPTGNNIFSYNLRKNKQIYVPSIIDINSDQLDIISLQDDPKKIAFEDFGFDDILSTNYGLKNFYRITATTGGQPDDSVNIDFPPIYLFDNHNHAYYFWYEARKQGLIGDNNILIHIDEHADMRDPGVTLQKPESNDLQKVFHFCNSGPLNVGNYIVPAQKEGLIGDIIQIRSDTSLDDYLEHPPGGDNIILNLDLDFFQPDLDFIDYDKKKAVVLDAAQKAKVITVCSSPFFINQELALKVFFDIFGKK